MSADSKAALRSLPKKQKKMGTAEEESAPLEPSAADLEANERLAEIQRKREENQEQQECIHIGGESRRTIKMYSICLVAVTTYMTISILLAWGIPRLRGDDEV